MKLGLQLGYWGAQPPENFVEVAQQAESLGFDSVWTAEAWGSDAFTPLAWIGAQTSKIKLGTSVVQLSARTPTATAIPRAAVRTCRSTATACFGSASTWGNCGTSRNWPPNCAARTGSGSC